MGIFRYSPLILHILPPKEIVLEFLGIQLHDTNRPSRNYYILLRLLKKMKKKKGPEG